MLSTFPATDKILGVIPTQVLTVNRVQLGEKRWRHIEGSIPYQVLLRANVCKFWLVAKIKMRCPPIILSYINQSSLFCARHHFPLMSISDSVSGNPKLKLVSNNLCLSFSAIIFSLFFLILSFLWSMNFLGLKFLIVTSLG